MNYTNFQISVLDFSGRIVKTDWNFQIQLIENRRILRWVTEPQEVIMPFNWVTLIYFYEMVEMNDWEMEQVQEDWELT